jgi:hypothetical protein
MATDAREQRGQQIAETCKLTRMGNEWFVPAQSGSGRYVVKADPDMPRCTCPDFELREMKCKHIYAVEYKIRQQANPDGSTTVTETLTVSATVEKKTTYKQDWPNYNAAQVNERRLFLSLLGDLCDTITEPAPKNRAKGGRPPVPLRDAIYSACLKVYSLMSARRFSGDLDDARDGGFIRHAPHFNTVLNVFDREETTPVLKAMIETSALPLRAVETCFAVDSTGFATIKYVSWFDQKYGVVRKQATWVKAHISTGVKTNVIAAANIDHQDAADSPQLPGLVATTRQTFTVKEVSADKAYAGVANFAAVEKAGGQFFPAFKENTTGAVGGAFEKAFHFFSFKRDEYLSHYHQRSNVETTFSMVKKKFGDAVKAKNELAQRNEVYAKFVCHNICVLISEMYAMGIQAIFDRPAACTKTESVAHKPLGI